MSSGDMMKNDSIKVTLVKKEAQVLAKLGDKGEEKPVKILWLRPVTGRGREVSIMTEDKKELALLDSLDELDVDSRRIAEEALETRYLVPRITAVLSAEAQLGNRYMEVQTDRGLRRFVLRDPNTNLLWVTDDTLTVRDTLGNRYEIESIEALDERSRANLHRVI